MTEEGAGGGEWLGKPCAEHPGVSVVRASRLAEDFEPVHPARDLEKTRRLMKSIRRDGWCGPPLVEHFEQLLTGAHRYTAIHDLAVADPHWAQKATVPIIELAYVFAEAGLSLHTVRESLGLDSDFRLQSDDDNWEPPEEDEDWESLEEWDDRSRYAEVLLELPIGIREKYGIDAVIEEEG